MTDIHNPQQPRLVPLEIDEIDVAEWNPTPDASGPATQVHMIITLKGSEAVLVMRFKGRQTLDKVVAALNEYAEPSSERPRNEDRDGVDL